MIKIKKKKHLKKIIALLMMGTILITQSSLVSHAKNIQEKEKDISIVSVEDPNGDESVEKITAIVQASYIGEYNDLVVGDEISIYNDDQQSIVYVYPVFENGNCVLLAYSNGEDAVSVTEDIEPYRQISELKETEDDYCLYISGGDCYAENEQNKELLYDTDVEFYKEDTKFLNESYQNKLRVYGNRKIVVEPISDKNVLAKIDMDEANDFVCRSCDINNTAIAKSSDVNLSTVDASTTTTSIGKYNDKKCNITKFVKQGNYNLCWAATVATIVDYKTSYNVTAKNVADKMGIGYDDGATESDVKSALKKYGLTYNISTSKLSWAQTKSNIDNNRPFEISLYCSESAHAITGYGYGTNVKSYLNCVYAWDSNGYKINFLYNGSVMTSGYTFTWCKSVY